jgi:hypothetical protein
LSQRTLLISALVLMAAGLLLSDVAGPLLDQAAPVDSRQQTLQPGEKPGYPNYGPGAGGPGGGFYGRMPGRIPRRIPAPTPSPNA